MSPSTLTASARYARTLSPRKRAEKVKRGEAAVNFFDAIRICFGKYVDFTGRATPSEYWYFALFIFLGQLICAIVYRPLGAAFVLATLLPGVAVTVRRLHDTDRSGWWLLLNVVPLIGWIVLIIWYAQRGTEGGNRFGEPPRFVAPI